jgi:transcriptional regulator with XRE-family HTH domain
MKKNIVTQFGERVRELRSQQDLTQESLANRSRISLKYIQKIEGKNPPNLSLGKLQSLADGFDIPLWKLLKF